MAHHEPQRASLLVPIFLCFLLLVLPSLSIKITGATTGLGPGARQRPIRQEISVFSESGPAWDLYIQALKRFQDAPTDDKFSYYQIAGIHGYPQVAWDDVYGNPNGSTGYCMHNSVLFELWHRPYLALFEVSMPDRSRFCVDFLHVASHAV